MQVEKIREAVEIAKRFVAEAEVVLQQSKTEGFVMSYGRHAKILKPLSYRLMQALQEMRRP